MSRRTRTMSRPQTVGERVRTAVGLALAGMLTVGVPGCGADATAYDPARCASRTAQALTLKCGDHSLSPVTDPESPDFGRVPCWLVAAGQYGSDFCKCDAPGFAPASTAQTNAAVQELDSTGNCTTACCLYTCFCELLQLEGDDLKTCQSGDPDGTLDIPGWCYVEPDPRRRRRKHRERLQRGPPLPAAPHPGSRQLHARPRLRIELRLERAYGQPSQA